MELCSNNLRAVWNSIYFPKETIFYVVVSPLADAQKAVKFITNQKGLQSQTTPYNSIFDKNAAAMEITTLLVEVAREQDRAPVLKTYHALPWAAPPAQRREIGQAQGLQAHGRPGRGRRSRTEREL